ncbi:MAG: glutamine--fructose-6-phosphate transaminase (isomerizing) [Dehalococcoidia bacterium]|nr:glutamine--fructose-6-phosphate transaminase (isomerizing) [Dehalococcoidia bacterium]
MCGIVGYLGRSPARPILLDMLAKLEYRGYDSCGIAVQGNPLRVFKDIRRVKELTELVPRDVPGTIGIGHTRWATHGGVSPQNAHPHLDCSHEIAVVHNGIIDNYQELRAELMLEGHVFISETDTEVIAHLLEKYYQGILQEAMESTIARLRGSWAMVAVAAKERTLVSSRQGAPLVIGVGSDEYLVASDAPAILGYATSVVYLEDGDIAAINDVELSVSRQGQQVLQEPKDISWSDGATEKNGHEHYTLKEILEQPAVLRRTLVRYLEEKNVGEGPRALFQETTDDLTILACGTSYHAGLIAKHVIEGLLRIPVSVINASEYACRPYPPATLAIAITQSGETADVIAAARRIKEHGARVLAVTNIPYSSITTVADRVMYTDAGPEVGVAATKTYTAQLAALFELVRSSPRLRPQAKEILSAGFVELPDMVARVCAISADIEDCARFIAMHERAFIIGRGVNLPTAYEGALKMKELAYIHAEGYSAGELKHGPFALLDGQTPIIAVIAADETRQAMLSSIHEVKARRSPVVALSYEGDEAVEKLSDFVIRLPKATCPFSAVVNAVALQLLAYHAAKIRHCPIDFPRNIAKSVTVE